MGGGAAAVEYNEDDKSLGSRELGRPKGRTGCVAAAEEGGGWRDEVRDSLELMKDAMRGEGRCVANVGDTTEAAAASPPPAAGLSSGS